ncbi:PqqD family peptide modification chaperone [Acidisoma sp. 7E03]
MNEDSIPRFCPDVRLDFDADADVWSLRTASAVLALGASSYAMIRLVDDSRSVNDIVTEVAEATGMPKPQVIADCLTLFEDLEARAILCEED